MNGFLLYSISKVDPGKMFMFTTIFPLKHSFHFKIAVPIYSNMYIVTYSIYMYKQSADILSEVRG